MCLKKQMKLLKARNHMQKKSKRLRAEVYMEQLCQFEEKLYGLKQLLPTLKSYKNKESDQPHMQGGSVIYVPIAHLKEKAWLYAPITFCSKGIFLLFLFSPDRKRKRKKEKKKEQRKKSLFTCISCSMCTDAELSFPSNDHNQNPVNYGESICYLRILMSKILDFIPSVNEKQLSFSIQ